jgi:hypothetical protein
MINRSSPSGLKAMNGVSAVQFGLLIAAASAAIDCGNQPPDGRAESLGIRDVSRFFSQLQHPLRACRTIPHSPHHHASPRATSGAGFQARQTQDLGTGSGPDPGQSSRPDLRPDSGPVPGAGFQVASGPEPGRGRARIAGGTPGGSVESGALDSVESRAALEVEPREPRDVLLKGIRPSRWLVQPMGRSVV